MLRRVVRVKLKIFVSVCGFPVDPGFIVPSGFLVVMVSRNAMDPSFSSSTVNLMCGLTELRWEWNSVRCSRAMQTWLSSTYLYHHLGGWDAESKAVSSTCSITKFAKIALTGEPIGQPFYC